MRWFLVGAILLLGRQNGFCEPPALTTTDSNFTVFSNNVGVFPTAVAALYPAKLKDKKKHIIADEDERARLLAQVLLDFEGDPDIVLLQEIWSIPARDRLIQDLADEYPYFHHPETIGAGVSTMQASGLMVFSKHPLRDFAFQVFTRGIGADKVARKGIIGVRLTKRGQELAIFNTHLQAGGKRDPSVKRDQLRECNAFIREYVGNDEDVIAILAGDFNIDSTDPAAYGEIFEFLSGARDSYKQGLSPLTHTGRNKKYPNKRIDYLLTFENVDAVSTIVDPAGNRISDHLAVFGAIPIE